ncbi:hypothetical protein ES705_50355 [subsurface metagenome]
MTPYGIFRDNSDSDIRNEIWMTDTTFIDIVIGELDPKTARARGQMLFSGERSLYDAAEIIDIFEKWMSTKLKPVAQKMMKAMPGGGDTETTMLDKLDKLGLLRKPGEEGRSTQIDMLDRLNELGMLKKTGEEDTASQAVRDLQTEVKELTESLHKQEMDTVKNAVGSLINQVSELRKEMSTQGKLEGRYALMEKTITTIDTQLSGIRSDVKPLVMAAGGGGSESRKKSPEERAKIAKGLKGAVALETEARALEDELVFGVRPQG